MRKSKTIIPLFFGFISLIALLFLMWFAAGKQLHAQFKIIDTSRISSQKMQLIATLIEVARKRTRLTNEMLLLEDFFERDEMGMQLHQLGTAFALTREELLKLPLSEFEKEIMAKQRKLIPILIEKQRKVMDMSMVDDIEVGRQAQELLFNEVLPRQGMVVDLFMQVITKLDDNIQEASTEVYEKYHRHERFQNILLIIFTALALLITFWVSRKTLAIEHNLVFEKKRTHLTLMSIGDAVITTDSFGHISSFNKVAMDLIGKPEAEIAGQKFTDVVHIQSSEGIVDLCAYMQNAVQAGEIVSMPLDMGLHIPNEQNRYIDVLLSPIMDKRVSEGCIVTFRDITEKRKMDQHLEKQAKHDALTGLLNRYALQEEYQHLISQTDEQEVHCLCVLDLDHFKAINDNCGHEAGDIVLKNISSIIKKTLRHADILARVGGDEFNIILEKCNRHNASLIMEKVLANISAYQYLDGSQSYRVGCSIGICEINTDDVAFSVPFKKADSACFRAKEGGRNRIEVN